MSKSEPLGIRLNNPGNIRYAKHNRFIGLVGQENGFCKFESSTLGVRAVCVVIRNYMRRNIRTVTDIINRYAPESDGNNTVNYITFVCSYIGKRLNPLEAQATAFNPDAPIYWQSTIFLYLIQAMLYFESNYKCSDIEVKEAYNLMDCYQ